jgi:hypothetical protein
MATLVTRTLLTATGTVVSLVIGMYAHIVTGTATWVQPNLPHTLAHDHLATPTRPLPQICERSDGRERNRRGWGRRCGSRSRRGRGQVCVAEGCVQVLGDDAHCARPPRRFHGGLSQVTRGL